MSWSLEYGNHFLYFAGKYVEHAEAGGVLLEVEDEGFSFVFGDLVVYAAMQTIFYFNYLLLELPFFLKLLVSYDILYLFLDNRVVR